jgi:hypothetical protein
MISVSTSPIRIPLSRSLIRRSTRRVCRHAASTSVQHHKWSSSWERQSRNVSLLNGLSLKGEYNTDCRYGTVARSILAQPSSLKLRAVSSNSSIWRMRLGGLNIMNGYVGFLDAIFSMDMFVRSSSVPHSRVPLLSPICTFLRHSLHVLNIYSRSFHARSLLHLSFAHSLSLASFTHPHLTRLNPTGRRRHAKVVQLHNGTLSRSLT